MSLTSRTGFGLRAWGVEELGFGMSGTIEGLFRSCWLLPATGAPGQFRKAFFPKQTTGTFMGFCLRILRHGRHGRRLGLLTGCLTSRCILRLVTLGNQHRNQKPSARAQTPETPRRPLNLPPPSVTCPGAAFINQAPFFDLAFRVG